MVILGAENILLKKKLQSDVMAAQPSVYHSPRGLAVMKHTYTKYLAQLHFSLIKK